ncbi:MAG: hypothetical protein GXP34_00065 [Actinobacteria bacterium]|nr:hypothetical protein [Actinomycetota bacterium]
MLIGTMALGEGVTTKRLMVMAMIMVLAAAPAQAANVSASCGTGGFFYTRGTADYWQDHTHGGYLVHYYYDTTQVPISHNWGFETGNQYGSVNGPNLTNPAAMCPN